jgi:hypothetical protein
MPTSIPFTVAPALRGTPQGQTFNSPQVTKTGHTKLYWEINIPSVSDYENTANHITSKMLVNGQDAASVWQGGRFTNKLGVVDPPPAVEFDLSGVPDGATLQVQVIVTAPAAFNVGIQNGLLS